MSIEKSKLHEAALRYVELGYKIIPIWPNAKTPMLKDWRNAKLDTPEKVDLLFNEYPDCNLAFEPEDMGLAIIDADTYHDNCNLGSLSLPLTMEVSTPRGGTHLYFVGSVPTTVGDEAKPDKGLGPHIDTRGRGSYALLPPSQVEGKFYHIKHDRPIVALPTEIEAKLAPVSAPLASAESRLDLPGNIARGAARLHDLVARGRIARSGHRGHDTTYEIACELTRDLGLSSDVALQLMLEHWYPHCEPNTDPNFVRERVLSAARNGQNEPGAFATAPPEEAFAGANLPATSQEGQVDPKKSKFWFMGTKEQLALPEPTWILKDLIPDRRIVLMSAYKGHFKTFLALDMCLGIASGKETFGTIPTETGLVFYGAHESLEDIAKLHRPAWFSVHDIPQEQEIGFYIAPGPHMALEEEMQEFGRQIEYRAKVEQKPIRLIVLDTYSACMMGLDENNPSDANRMVFFCRSLIETFHCSVLILAHLGKDATRGTRGSNALEAGVDGILDLSRDGDQVKVKVRYQRGARERQAPYCFEARPFAKSITFNLLSSEEQSALEQENNPYDHRKIAQALRDLGAVNDTNTVVTRVLAMKLQPQEETESHERYAGRIETVDRALRRLARDQLKKFTFGVGKHLAWCLPPGVAPDPDGLD